MDSHPTVLGQQPILTGTALGGVLSFVSQPRYDTWFNALYSDCTEIHNYHFLIVAQEECSYKMCNKKQTRWLLYKLPFKTNRSFTLSEIRHKLYEYRYLIDEEKSDLARKEIELCRAELMRFRFESRHRILVCTVIDDYNYLRREY